MPDLSELEQQLTALPSRQYSELIRKVDARRRQAVRQEQRDLPPSRGVSKEEFARWVARHHYAIDKGITRIVYLPTGAPPEEVRLVEVNELASIPEDAPVEAVDFLPDVDGLKYTLFVADVTPRQFDGIMQGPVQLPLGWKLENAVEIPAE